MDDATIEAAPMCFACGVANPIGLKISFEMKDGRCTGQFTANENHVGFENTVHSLNLYDPTGEVWAFSSFNGIGGTVDGTITVTPEPLSALLMMAGLPLLRRRR